MKAEQAARIVVIGGGTGTFALLSGLKQHTDHITALVNMADDGGSTGVLRDEQGVLPPGDVRQCLVALSDSDKLRDLFNYRFEGGSLEGHAFGNLFLTALEKMTGSFPEAVELASHVLNITGTVEPITLTQVTLCAEGVDGTPIKGQLTIAHEAIAPHPRIWLEPEAEPNPRAIEAILGADMVVIAPGNLYGSLAPALVVPGIGKALRATEARCVYVCNLVTKPGPTDGFAVHDFAEEIERLAGGHFLDDVIYNTETPTDDLLEKYAHQGELSVRCDLDALAELSYRSHGVPLLDLSEPVTLAGDKLAHMRSFIRHDSQAIATELLTLL